MGRIAWGILALVTALASAQGADVPFNIDFTVGWGGFYRPQEWTPIDIDIRLVVPEKDKDKVPPYGGAAVVSIPQDSMTTMEIRQGFTVAPGSPVHLSLAAKISYNASNARLILQDLKGHRDFDEDKSLLYSGRSRGSGEVQPNEILIGTVGQQSYGLAQWGSHVAAANNNGHVFVQSKLAKLLPWDWTGYASLDLLVLYNPKWEEMTNQAKAIGEWVSNGGRVLIVLGDHPLPTEGPIADLLPFKPTPGGQVKVVPYSGGKSTSVSAWMLGAKLPPGWKETYFGAARSVWMYGPHGFGKVGVLAFDPNALSDAQPQNQAQFWTSLTGSLLANARQITPREGGGQERDPYEYRYQRENSTEVAHTNSVVDHLYAIPELKPLHIGWVIGLLALLAVLLGPVDYLVLKKLDRLPWTWITSAVIITLFTVGAYFGVQALRAGSMQVRAVTVVDAVADADGKCPEAWSTHFCGIFAPDSDVYRFERMTSGGWWASMTRENNGYYGPDNNIGSRRIYCLQRDGSNVPTDVPINIWSMQCLIGEAREKAMPFAAKVRTEGRRDAGLSVEITNTSTAAIRGGVLRAAGRGNVVIGRVEPGQTATFKTGQPIPGGEGAYDPARFSMTPVGQEATQARGTEKRTQALNELISQGRMVAVEVAFDKAPLPYQVNPSNYQTDHVLIARMLVPIAKAE